MKKVLVIILLCALLFSFTFVTGAVASSESEVSPYARAVAYANKHPRRDVTSGAESAAAATLSQALTGYGYAVSEFAEEHTVSESSGQKVAYQFKHIFGFKDNGKEQSVLIGCFYGGYEPKDSYGVGKGASIALSVGTLLYIAEALGDNVKDYNIVIVFWGGMEVADTFNVKKCGVDLDKVALYINLDAVGAGDYDYLYADDLPRAQEKYFRSFISEIGASIKKPPVYKRQTMYSISKNDPYSYSHLGLLGVNRFFMGEDIPCVNFVGGSWEHDCGLYRYAGKGDLEGTSIDTFETIDELNGGVAKTEERLYAVGNVVVKGLTDDGLSSMLADAAKETTSMSLDNDLAYYLISFIGIGLLMIVLVILFLKQGKDRREEIWEATLLDARGDDPYIEFHEVRNDDAHDDHGDDDKGDHDDDHDDDIFRF